MANQSAAPGDTLIGNAGLWVNQPTGYAYQLKRNGVVFQTGIWNAAPAYVVQNSDIGDVITISVTATNGAGAGPIAQSMAVLIV